MSEREEQLSRVDAWWRAANYLSVGQIYLLDNPLLREPLPPEHVKPRLLGHWGTTPGLNFVWSHLNRAIVERDQEVLFVTGPGHGGPAVVAQAWMEGTYSEVYPGVGRDAAGLQALMRQFSFPGGIPSHAAPETPGSMNEGGELGYCLAHAYGAAFDNPDLLVACVVGDGEAETGALAASWHSTKFLNPRTDGAVLPVLHLNGWKIANPTVLARIPEPELVALLTGYGFRPYLFTADADEDHADGARPDGRPARRGARRDPPDPGRRPLARRHRWPARRGRAGAAHAQGLDGARGGRRREGGGHLPLAPGAAGRDPHPRRAPRAARGVDALVPAGGAVRRRRSPASRTSTRCGPPATAG